MIELYNGDCLIEMDRIADKSIDLILTDLPYGTTNCKWDCIIPFEKMWKQVNRIIKDNSAICFFGSEPFSSKLRCSNLKMFKYDWVWDKITANGFLNAKVMPMKEHEIISVFSKGKAKYYPVMEKMDKSETYRCYAQSDINSKLKNDGQQRVRTHRYPKSIIKISNANHKNKYHPTQKPIELLEYLIKTYTQEGDMVLDFTMGSGSTGVACKITNRNFIGIELDEKYFEIAQKRITEENYE